MFRYDSSNRDHVQLLARMLRIRPPRGDLLVGMGIEDDERASVKNLPTEVSGPLRWLSYEDPSVDRFKIVLVCGCDEFSIVGATQSAGESAHWEHNMSVAWREVTREAFRYLLDMMVSDPSRFSRS